MPILYIATFIYFLNAVNADSIHTRRGFIEFHGRAANFTGFWTESSDNCKSFTKRAIKDGLKMAQGHFTIPVKYGGFFCFPISRKVSRVGIYKTEIMDDNDSYR